MSDTKVLIKYVRDRMNDGPNITFGKPTVSDLADDLEQAEARAEHDRERLKVQIDHTATLVRLKGEEETRAEKAEARVKSRNNHIHRLLGEALENERNLDGMKSRWQAAEAENARLTKMVDWLANKLIDCPPEFTNCAVDCAECRKEAARRALAAGEGE